MGYIGEFGKKIIDDLARLAGIDPHSYETIRIGMNVTDAICRNQFDTGIGLLISSVLNYKRRKETLYFCGLDQLAGLGCCCFCSIQFIVPRTTLQSPENGKLAFLMPFQRGAAFTTEQPEEAYELLCRAKPKLRTPTYQKIFTHTLPFFLTFLIKR